MAIKKGPMSLKEAEDMLEENRLTLVATIRRTTVGHVPQSRALAEAIENMIESKILVALKQPVPK